MSRLRTLLLAVGRHLRRERWATSARYAAWGAALVALLAVLLYLSARPVTLGELAFCLVLIGLVAAGQALVTRPSPAECADWADRYLGGRSGYATCLEVSARPRLDPDPAVQHLEAWVAQSVPQSLAQLAARPFDAALRKPLAAALVCVALAVALLQLPTGVPEPASASARVATTVPAPIEARPGAQAPPSRESAVGDATRPTPSAQAPARDTRSNTTAPADARDAATQAERLQDVDATLAARTTREAAATGREAGDVADTGGESLFTAPWQGELAARLHEIATQAPRRELRADTGQPADFTGSTVADPGRDGVASRVAAPATPPPALTPPPFSPAERAYLRAYLSDRRTDP